MKELKFVNTCTACPEQYDVYDGEVQVGYVRLRHGYLSVRYPDVDGTEVYGTGTRGDGQFYDEFERQIHLTNAAKAISKYISHHNDFEYPGDFIISVD